MRGAHTARMKTLFSYQHFGTLERQHMIGHLHAAGYGLLLGV
jgi:hypothetical protein